MTTQMKALKRVHLLASSLIRTKKYNSKMVKVLPFPEPSGLSVCSCQTSAPPWLLVYFTNVFSTYIRNISAAQRDKLPRFVLLLETNVK